MLKTKIDNQIPAQIHILQTKLVDNQDDLQPTIQQNTHIFLDAPKKGSSHES